MAYCNHDLSGAYRHLLYRSMQHGLAYSSMILLNKKKTTTKIYRDKIIIIIISSFSLFPFLLPFPFLSLLPSLLFPFSYFYLLSFLLPLLSKSYNTPLYSSDILQQHPVHILPLLLFSGGQSTQIKYLSKSTDTYSKILLQ